MKFTQPLLLVALLFATSAAALPMTSDKQTSAISSRDGSETTLLLAREPEVFSEDSIFERYSPLLERSPSFFSKIFKFGKGLIGLRRDSQTMEARSWIDADSELVDREDDEYLYARSAEPVLVERAPSFFSKIFRFGKGVIGLRRDADTRVEARGELEQRSARSFFSKIFKFGKGLIGLRRDSELLDARSEGVEEQLLSREHQELTRREVDEAENIYARDLQLEY
ncbi:hypothetical protein H0H81_009229 [Sphagnurus paluster]|uniref:Uncharacterized protein n=1 Tax=Sphagnurus paluster TaxID=117069 RepID=A0A9P7K428_9AGAR|nr:hypothetical protein H0H81_009229 [Sphagnurus paluster]